MTTGRALRRRPARPAAQERSPLHTQSRRPRWGLRTHVSTSLCLARFIPPALIAACALMGCGKEISQSPAPPPAQPLRQAPIAGVETYRRALAEPDDDERLGLLEQAVRANARLPEAWYELGRLKLKLAPQAAKTDEAAGVQMFRGALEAEQEAWRLIEAGKVSLWSAAEEMQARIALEADLTGAEETLRTPEASLAALRQRVY
jgi:hypothetical protein